MRSQDGGVVVKLLAWLLVLAVVASVGLYVWVRAQSPLEAGTTATDTVGAGPAGAVRLVPDGRIVVATTLTNDGRWPLTITGLGRHGGDRTDPYVPVDLGLGDGATASLEALAPLVPTELEPGQSIGVVVVFGPNAGLACRRFPASADGETPTTLDRFPVHFEIAGIGVDQTVRTAEPFATVAPVTRAACEAVADISG